ncbi:MAG: 2TM domain-containing protein [Saprospiraceae bacterium]
MDKKTLTYLKAEKRVKELKSFYRFLFIWASISCFLMALNFFSDRHEFWSIYPVLGLTLALAFKYARVFGWPGFGKDWEERMFYEELERIKEREDRIQYMLNKEKTSRLSAPGTSLDPELDIDKLELKELRKKWNDSDFV